MKKIVGLLIGLLIVVFLGVYFSEHLIKMSIQINSWQINLPLWLAVLTILIFYLLLFILGKVVRHFFRAIHFLGNIRGSLHFKYADTNLENGIYAFIRGDFKQAERLLLKVVNIPTKNKFATLALVMVASAMNDSQKVKNYLSFLKLKNTSNTDIDDLIRAGLAIKMEKYQEADYLLEGLSVNTPHNNRLLLLKKSLYLNTKEVEKLQSLIPLMKKYSTLSNNELQRFYEQVNLVTIEQFSQESVSFEQWNNFWESLPKEQKTQKILLFFIPICIKNKQNQLAESLISSSLDVEWDKKLIQYYGQLKDINYKKQLTQCEKWLQLYPDDIDLLLTLAEVAIKLQLWAQAEHYLNRSIDIKPTGKAYFILAELQVHLDNNERKERNYYIQSAKLQLSSG